MEKVALRSREEYQLAVNVMSENYKRNLEEWKEDEKKAVKMLAKEFCAIMNALPDEEICIEKVEIRQVHEFLLRVLKESSVKGSYEERIESLLREMEEVQDLYKEIVEALSESFRVEVETEEIEKVGIEEVIGLVKELRVTEMMFEEMVEKMLERKRSGESSSQVDFGVLTSKSNLVSYNF